MFNKQSLSRRIIVKSRESAGTFSYLQLPKIFDREKHSLWNSSHFYTSTTSRHSILRALLRRLRHFRWNFQFRLVHLPPKVLLARSKQWPKIFSFFRFCLIFGVTKRLKFQIQARSQVLFPCMCSRPLADEDWTSKATIWWVERKLTRELLHPAQLGRLAKRERQRGRETRENCAHKPAKCQWKDFNATHDVSGFT